MIAFLNENIIALIALLISIFGGIPGIISIINFFTPSKLGVHFEKENSFACSILSSKDELNGKLAIILLSLTLSGKGLIPSYIKRVEIYIRIGTKWIKGEDYTPTSYFVSDNTGIEKDCSILVNTINNNVVFFRPWQKFIPGNTKLEYGQPLTISKAAVFSVNKDKYSMCKRIKIIASDFNNRNFSNKMQASVIFNEINKEFIVLDNIMNTGIQNVRVEKQ